MASKIKDECPDADTCYICQFHIPSASKVRHEGSYLHQAALQIASTALERVRAHVAPISLPVPETVEPSEATEDKDNTSPVSFCGACAAPVPVSDRAHSRTKTHLMAALDDQLFEELVRGYVGEEELCFLEMVSRDPCDVEESGVVVEKSGAIETYTCFMCALEIPQVFKNEHELSSRHRCCAALANAASRRAIAFLTPTPTRVEAPSKTHEEKMVALLKAYTGVDIMKLERTETADETDEAENKSKTEATKRLSSREYFTEIMPFLQYIGAFYTLIIDDTDFVTIKTEKGTYLRVHVVNFNSLYNIGGSEEYQMKCRMCDGYNFNVSYSSKGHLDRLHVMSLGHIKLVLTPVETIHCIRKIDNTHSLCVLCNLSLPTHSVEDHTMRDIQHTAFLTEALQRGKLFKENKDDMKILIYTSPPVQPRGFFMRNPPNNFNSVLPHHSGLFGQGVPFGQNTAFGHKPTFGLNTAGQNTAFGHKPTFRQNTAEQNTAGQNTAFGHNPTFGQNTAFGHNTTFGQSTAGQNATFGRNTAFGYNPTFGQNTAGQNSTFGQNTTGLNATFGHNTNAGQSAAFGHNSASEQNPAFVQKTTFGPNSVQTTSGAGFGTTQKTLSVPFGHNATFELNTAGQHPTFGKKSVQTTSGTGFGTTQKPSSVPFEQNTAGQNSTFGQNSAGQNPTFGQNTAGQNPTFGQNSVRTTSGTDFGTTPKASST